MLQESRFYQWVFVTPELLGLMPQIELTLVIGRYAMDWHMPGVSKASVTNTVKEWRSHWPTTLPLPHPSPRNNIWLNKNLWFETDVIPILQERVKALIL